MKRWFYFFFCVFFGLALLVGGWMMPVHLRAVDSSVLLRAGLDSPALVNRGLALVREKKPGAAEVLLAAAERENIYGHDKLRWALTYSFQIYPELELLGLEPRLKILEELKSKGPASMRPAPGTNTLEGEPIYGLEPFTGLMMQSENRTKVLRVLQASPYPAVQELLRGRSLTNTVLFPPSQSASGQAFDAALAMCGILIEAQHLNPNLTAAVSAAATEALRGGNSQALEEICFDFMSLGQRFNWGQLAAFVQEIERPETLHYLAGRARKAQADCPSCSRPCNYRKSPTPS